jgi:hypothetical protein
MTFWSLRRQGALFALVAATACSASDPVHVASVTVTPSTATKAVGETVQLSAITNDAKGVALTGRAITWSTSSASLAVVSSAGLVTAVAPGPVVITAMSDGQSGTAAITVVPPPVASVIVTPTTSSITEIQTLQLAAVTKTPGGATVTGRAVTWTSSAPTIATVNSAGLVSGVSPGSVNITATSEGVTGSAALTITISPCNAAFILPISAGQTVNGTLAATDCPLADSTYADTYRATLAANNTVDVQLKSAAFDAYLFILRLNATGTDYDVIGADDDSGGGTNARLSGLLNAGTYYFVANSANPNGFGPYTLTFVSPFVAASRSNLSAISIERVPPSEAARLPSAFRNRVRKRRS